MAVLKFWRKKKALIAVSVAIIQSQKQRRRRISVVRDCWRKPWNTRRFDQGN